MPVAKQKLPKNMGNAQMKLELEQMGVEKIKYKFQANQILQPVQPNAIPEKASIPKLNVMSKKVSNPKPNVISGKINFPQRCPIPRKVSISEPSVISKKTSFPQQSGESGKPDFTTEYRNPRKVTNTNSLYLAVFKLIRYLYTLVKNFPKEYKYTLGEDILKLAWATLDCVITANVLPNNEKAGCILKASITFDKLKYRLRLAHEIKTISTKQQTFLIEQNTQIAKMLAGWQKWAKHSAVSPFRSSLAGQP